MRLLLAILLLLLAAPASAQQSQGMSQAVVVSSCGGGALPTGALNQLAMNPQGQLCIGGSVGPSGCAQATAYLARATGETAHAADLTTLICGLVTDGVWANLDALYVLAQQTQADARLNLTGTSYSLTGSGATFTAYQGFSAFPVPPLDTGFNPATAPSPHYVQNNASLGVWAYNAVDGNVQIGSINVNGGDFLFANNAGSYYCIMNDAITNLSPFIASPGTVGWFSGDRNAFSATNYYFNGVSKGSQASLTQAPTSMDMFIGGINSGFNTAKTLSAAEIGGYLGPTLQTALYTRLRTYLTAVGVP